MTFLELAKKRYSCRKYDTRPVEKEKIDLILEAGRIAPSAVNLQPWHIIVIREKKALKQFHQVYHREWFREAPVVMVICGDHDKSWKRSDGKDHCDIDAAIAIDHMTLQAAELDLGTCWICNFKKDLTSEILGLPKNFEPIAILPVGYPLDIADPDRHSAKRKPLTEIVSYEKYLS